MDPGILDWGDQSIRAQLPSEPQDPLKEIFIVNHALTHALLLTTHPQADARMIEAAQVDASSNGTAWPLLGASLIFDPIVKSWKSERCDRTDTGV